MAFAFDAPLFEGRAGRRDVHRLGRLTLRRRRPQGIEELPYGRGIGRRSGGRIRGVSLKPFDLRAERFDNGVVGLRLVELGGDEIEQQTPVSGLRLDGKDCAGCLSEDARGACETEHQQRNRVEDATVHGGADSPGGQCDRYLPGGRCAGALPALVSPDDTPTLLARICLSRHVSGPIHATAPGWTLTIRPAVRPA